MYTHTYIYTEIIKQAKFYHKKLQQIINEKKSTQPYKSQFYQKGLIINYILHVNVHIFASISSHLLK